jgi:hypothetical protein
VAAGTFAFAFIGGPSVMTAGVGGASSGRPPASVVGMTRTDAQLEVTFDARRRMSFATPAARPLEADMRRSTTVIAGAAVAAVVAGGAGVAAAAGSEDAAEGPDASITGDALQRAGQAALAETGGGRVTGTEVGDEESYYEVEVTREDGSQVDVQLDESFAVVGGEADEEDPGEGAG